MKQSEPFVITISRMLGSGGLIVGRQLAEELNIAYFDREILSRAAKEFGLSEEELKDYDEKPTPIWELFFKSGILENPESFVTPKFTLPTDRQLFKEEGEIIKSIVKERSTVIIGRGGAHILRDHPRHISVFLHCDTEIRKQRIQELFHISEKDAKKIIAASDSKRSQHYHMFTGQEWAEARQYTMCLDTGKIGLDESVEVILNYAKRKFELF